jgi:ATP-dependent Clp protease protease subunit
MITMNSGSEGARPEDRIDFADPVLQHRQLLLFGDIDQDAAKRIVQELLFLDNQSHEPIDLYLMTPGGDLKSAFAIEHVIRTIQSKVNTYALSECNSGGAMLLAAGTGTRRAFRGAIIVLHGMSVHGRFPAGMVDNLQDGYTKFWQAHAKLPSSWLPLPHDITHVLTAEQALQYGVVDAIVER